MVNMLKIVNHIGATSGSKEKHQVSNGVRQPNPPMVNMLKIVNHIGATSGSKEKHQVSNRCRPKRILQAPSSGKS